MQGQRPQEWQRDQVYLYAMVDDTIYDTEKEIQDVMYDALEASKMYPNLGRGVGDPEAYLMDNLTVVFELPEKPDLHFLDGDQLCLLRRGLKPQHAWDGDGVGGHQHLAPLPQGQGGRVR